jgi:hypothetical protein
MEGGLAKHNTSVPLKHYLQTTILKGETNRGQELV